MKFFKIFILVLIVIIVLLFITLFLVIRTFDVNKFKPQITSQISRVINREVALGEIKLDISFTKGITLNLRNLAIADDPQFSKEIFLKVDNIHLGVDLWELITTKQLHALSVELISPNITLIRNESGQFNAQSFSVDAKDANPGNDGATSSKTVRANAKASTALSTLLIKSINIKEGILNYVDKTFDPPISLKAQNLDLVISDFSLNRPVDFDLKGSLFSNVQNIKVKGQFQFDLANLAVHFSKVKTNSDLSQMAVADLQKSFPMIKPMKIKENLGGQLEATINDLTFNKAGLGRLLLEGALTNGRLDSGRIPFILDQINMNFKTVDQDLSMNANMPLASGNLNFEGTIKDILKSQAFKGRMTFEKLDLTKLISAKDQPVEFQGKLSGKFDVNGKGFDPNAVLSSLDGRGHMDIKDGKLININVLKLVLSKISMLPRLVEKLEANLPEKYKNKLKENDTEFRKVSLDTAVKGRKVFIEQSEIQTDMFAITGAGEMSFNQDLVFNAGFHIPTDLSKSIVESVKEMQYLENENREIFIPLSIEGKIPNLAYMPDLEYLGKKIIIQYGAEELQKVLKKALGVKDEASSPEGTPTNPQSPNDAQSQGQDSTQTQTRESSPEEQLIGSVLNAIFKK